MEEAPENSKELSHSAHANGMNEWMKFTTNISLILLDVMYCKAPGNKLLTQQVTTLQF
jgi:hypothetical protein